MTKQDTKCCNSEWGKATETHERSGEREWEQGDNQRLGWESTQTWELSLSPV